MNNLLGKDNNVAFLPSWYEACLERVNEVEQEGLEPLDKKLRYPFVKGVA